MAQQTNIYITKPDHERLTKLIEVAREREGESNRKYLDSLEEELERAEVVQQKDIPADAITMRSTVRLKDLDTSEEVTYQLMFPTEANFDEGKISVLAPIGTAMIGYRHGDVIEWEVPSGVRRLRVEEVLYQPESRAIITCDSGRGLLRQLCVVSRFWLLASRLIRHRILPPGS